jgi:hypothetical protein
MKQKQIKQIGFPILCLFSLSLFAQGTRVRVTSEKASVYLGSNVLGTVENGHEFRSMEKRGKWYAVTLVIDGTAKVGWVKETEVEVVDKLETALIAPPLPDGLYRKDGAVFSKKDGGVLVRIPAGEFIPGTRASLLMGKIEKEHVEEFYLDAYEVTNAQYMKFVSEAGHQKPKYIGEERFNGPRQPVVGVSLDDAKAYAAWAGRRLPTVTHGARRHPPPTTRSLECSSRPGPQKESEAHNWTEAFMVSSTWPAMYRNGRAPVTASPTTWCAAFHGPIR